MYQYSIMINMAAKEVYGELLNPRMWFVREKNTRIIFRNYRGMLIAGKDNTRAFWTRSVTEGEKNVLRLTNIWWSLSLSSPRLSTSSSSIQHFFCARICARCFTCTISKPLNTHWGVYYYYYHSHFLGEEVDVQDY